MLIQKDGVYMKYVCPICGDDDIGKSSLYGPANDDSMVHCFNCPANISKSDCPVEPVTSEVELAMLRQDDVNCELQMQLASWLRQ